MTTTGAARMAEPGRRGLFVGILAYRWATLTWMTVLAVITRDRLGRVSLAFAVLAGVVVWNAVFTVWRGWERPAWRWTDLAISTALLPFAGFVMEEGGAAGGAPFFATSYPASSALTVGAAGTPPSGLAAGVVLSLGLIASRSVNGGRPQRARQLAVGEPRERHRLLRGGGRGCRGRVAVARP